MNSSSRTRLTALGIITLLTLGAAETAGAALQSSDPVPRFSLISTDGKTYTEDQIIKADMAVLYVFSTKCKPCETGLRQLQKLIERSHDQRLVILGLGKQQAAALNTFASSLGLGFPVLVADPETFAKFDTHIYPVVYIFGPEGRVQQIMKGNDAGVMALLASLGDQEIQRANPAGAQQLYAELEALGDKSGTAQAGKGYSLLKEGKLAAAETTFRTLANAPDAQAAVKGREGLAETYLQQGKLEQASQMADQALQLAATRSVPHLIKGNVLYRQGNKQAAEVEIALASSEQSISDFRWQKAEAHYAQGNLQRAKRQPKMALAAYKKAVEENPHYAEALSNQGVTLQELGNPEEALKVFSQLKGRRAKDPLVDSLIRQAQAAIRQKQDLQRQRYIDKLVKDLAQRYREQRQERKAVPADEWTSSVMALSILGFQNRAGEDLMGRAGLETVLQDELTQQGQAANLKVVERAVVDQLLEELNLGSSALADPDASLRLGRVLAARLIATGNLTQLGGKENIISLRLVDTETTDIVLPLSEHQSGAIDPASIAARFVKAISTAVKDRYPLRGRIAEVEGDTVIINLGRKHSVTPGMVFEVLGEGKPVELGGRVLGQRQTKLGELEVTTVEDLMSYARPIGSAGQWEKNQKIMLKTAGGDQHGS